MAATRPRSRLQVLLVFAVAIIVTSLVLAFTGLADWTDKHSTTIQAFAIILLTLATAMYMWFTRELVVKTSEQRSPYVFFEVNKRGAMLDSCVRNSGERGAENIRIEIKQDVLLFGNADQRGFLGWPLFKEPIPFLPPGRSISQPLTNLQTAVPRLYKMSPEERVIQYDISYRDGVREYHHSHRYDLSFLTPVGGDSFPIAGDYVAQLKEEVSSLNKSLDRSLGGIRDLLEAISMALSSQRK